MVVIAGRGEHASAPGTRVYPEQVKEGIYHDPTLAKLATANFRLISDPLAVQIRIQLSPTIKPSPDLDAAFRAAISHYVGGSFDVTCREYETFRDGMALDYERKFRYVAS